MSAALCMKLHDRCGDQTGSCDLCDPSPRIATPSPAAQDAEQNAYKAPKTLTTDDTWPDTALAKTIYAHFAEFEGLHRDEAADSTGALLYSLQQVGIVGTAAQDDPAKGLEVDKLVHDLRHGKGLSETNSETGGVWRDAWVHATMQKAADALATATRQIAELRKAYLAAEADAQSLRKANAEASTRAYGWMVAHDMLKAGKSYDLPSPADVPTNLARALAAEAARVRVEVSEDALIRAASRVCEAVGELHGIEPQMLFADVLATMQDDFTLTQRGA